MQCCMGHRRNPERPERWFATSTRAQHQRYHRSAAEACCHSELQLLRHFVAATNGLIGRREPTRCTRLRHQSTHVARTTRGESLPNAVATYAERAGMSSPATGCMRASTNGQGGLYSPDCASEARSRRVTWGIPGPACKPAADRGTVASLHQSATLARPANWRQPHRHGPRHSLLALP